jgi:hypothetical protein
MARTKRLPGGVAMRLRPCHFFPLLFLAVLLTAQEKPTPSADELVRTALADQQRILTLLEKYSYTKRVVAETTDPKGKVTSRDERVASFAPCNGKVCSTLVSVNGAPPKPKEIKAHEKGVQKSWEKRAKMTAEDRKKDEDEDLSLSRDFLAVYNFSHAGKEEHQGRPALVVAFTPKEEKVNVSDKDNRVLTKMAGRLWLSDPGGKVLASDMHMVKPIKVWGGFAGAINNLTSQADYAVDPDSGMYLPKKTVTVMEVRILFSKGTWKVTEEYSDFKPTVPATVTN